MCYYSEESIRRASQVRVLGDVEYLFNEGRPSQEDLPLVEEETVRIEVHRGDPCLPPPYVGSHETSCWVTRASKSPGALMSVYLVGEQVPLPAWWFQLTELDTEKSGHLCPLNVLQDRRPSEEGAAFCKAQTGDRKCDISVTPDTARVPGYFSEPFRPPPPCSCQG